jgi:hypothetical protein
MWGEGDGAGGMGISVAAMIILVIFYILKESFPLEAPFLSVVFSLQSN